MPALLKKKNPFITLALFLVLFFGMGNFLFSQNKPEVLSPIPGQADLSIYQIAEDGQGFIYLGTDKGLIWYDGNEFFNLSKALSSPGKEVPQYITHLIADPKRPRFWLGVAWGLWYYDWEGHDFGNIQHPAFSRWGEISCMALQNDSILWFGIVKEGIFRFNTYSGEITRFHFDNCQRPACNPDKLNTVNALAFTHRQPSVIWAGSLEGLWRWDLEKMEKEVFYNASSSVPSTFLNNNHFTGLPLVLPDRRSCFRTIPANFSIFIPLPVLFGKWKAYSLFPKKYSGIITSA